MHIFECGVLWRYLKLFVPVDTRYVRHEIRDLCLLRLVHAFCEAAPLLLIQLYLLFKVRKNHRNPFALDARSFLVSFFLGARTEGIKRFNSRVFDIEFVFGMLGFGFFQQKREVEKRGKTGVHVAGSHFSGANLNRLKSSKRVQRNFFFFFFFAVAVAIRNGRIQSVCSDSVRDFIRRMVVFSVGIALGVHVSMVDFAQERFPRGTNIQNKKSFVLSSNRLRLHFFVCESATS